MEYAVEIRTVSGIADSAYLDRLAAIVYELPGLLDPMLGLNEDGSLTGTFSVVSADPLEAVQTAVARFADALVAAGANARATAVGRLAVELVDDREHALT